MICVISYFQEKQCLKVINLEYGHRCRADPVEAAIYSLEAAGEYLHKFKANASAELTVELEGKKQRRKQQERKQERSAVELPIDFTRDHYALV